LKNRKETELTPSTSVYVIEMCSLVLDMIYADGHTDYISITCSFHLVRAKNLDRRQIIEVTTDHV